MKKTFLLIATALFCPLFCWAQSSQDTHPTTFEAIIALLPVAFFLFISIIIIIKLKKDQTKLSDILAEKDVPPPTPPNATNPPAASTSRFIAFTTGLVALTIGICLCTFFMYVYFTSSKTVDLSNLTNVIWGLGIGVLPYGFNKASAAVK